jgi:LysR family glycine cleavage system transcriptional activator
MSFTRAAGELGMTQAAVSYQIKLLEDRIGAALFRRLTRQLALTEAGQRLAPIVADVFARLNSAFTAVAGKNDGILAISSVVTFTTNWLVPRIGKFQIAWPEIAVRMDTDAQAGRFCARGIRRRHTRRPAGARHLARARQRSATLGRPHAVLCARLFARYGPISTAADMVKMPLIGEFNPDRPQPDGVEADWRSWFHAPRAPRRSRCRR